MSIIYLIFNSLTWSNLIKFNSILGVIWTIRERRIKISPHGIIAIVCHYHPSIGLQHRGRGLTSVFFIMNKSAIVGFNTSLRTKIKIYLPVKILAWHSFEVSVWIVWLISKLIPLKTVPSRRLHPRLGRRRIKGLRLPKIQWVVIIYVQWLLPLLERILNNQFYTW